MGNQLLNRAKYVSTSDRWYTPYEVVEKELNNYSFRDQRVLCNADDPIESAFTCYFITNFHRLKLKQLTCISYFPSSLRGLYQLNSPNWEQLSRFNAGYVIQMTAHNSKIQLLQGNGGFDSSETEPFWENSDIICTNPPFSKFRKFFDLILQYNKSYLVVSNLNAVTYTNVFPQIKSGAAHLGWSYGAKFRVAPSDESASQKWEDTTGQCWKKLGTAVWLTNLPTTHQPNLTLTCSYSPELHPKYDGQNVIHVDKLAIIPKDYDGVMGVPITYLRYHNPQRFEIIGKADHGNTDIDLFVPRINGTKTFKRILIRHTQN